MHVGELFAGGRLPAVVVIVGANARAAARTMSTIGLIPTTVGIELDTGCAVDSADPSLLSAVSRFCMISHCLSP